MAGRVHVDSASLSKLAQHVSTLSGKLRRIADDAESAVAQGPAAWGDDEFGSQFAGGDQGFVLRSGTMVTHTQTMATSFDNLAGGLEESATALARFEQANTDSF